MKVLFENPKAEDTMQCIVCIGWLRKSSYVFGMLICRVLSRTCLQVYGWLEGSTKKYTRAHVHSGLQFGGDTFEYTSVTLRYHIAVTCLSRFAVRVTVLLFP